MQAIVDTVAEGIVTFDPRRVIDSINAAALRLELSTNIARVTTLKSQVEQVSLILIDDAIVDQRMRAEAGAAGTFDFMLPVKP